MLRVPQAIYRTRGLDFRGLADPAWQMAPCDPPYVLFKEGDQLKSNSTRVGLSYEEAWFLTHRIRLAMAVDPLKSLMARVAV
jgi:hypothetical protein